MLPHLWCPVCTIQILGKTSLVYSKVLFLFDEMFAAYIQCFFGHEI
jgi:hypothetical protein